MHQSSDFPRLRFQPCTHFHSLLPLSPPHNVGAFLSYRAARVSSSAQCAPPSWSPRTWRTRCTPTTPTCTTHSTRRVRHTLLPCHRCGPPTHPFLLTASLLHPVAISSPPHTQSTQCCPPQPTLSPPLAPSQPKMHEGLVLKHNANQRYATNSISAALFREVGEDEGG